jgi:Ca2+-binding EF-hand superfamily protein
MLKSHFQVAKQSFDAMDGDQSGNIGREEIYKALSDVFRSESLVTHLTECNTPTEDILNSEDLKVRGSAPDRPCDSTDRDSGG